MSFDVSFLIAEIEKEITHLDDHRVADYLRNQLLPPFVISRRWDYGQSDDHYPCWTVLRNKKYDTDIVYSEHGFGPRLPWGLVFSDAEEGHMGMDSSWHIGFLDACFDSRVVIDLPIWKVFERDQDGELSIISNEGTWDDTWKLVIELREKNADRKYDCDNSIYSLRDEARRSKIL